MKKISFAVALLCGMSEAREDWIKVTQDTTRIENAFDQAEEYLERLNTAIDADSV